MELPDSGGAVPVQCSSAGTDESLGTARPTREEEGETVELGVSGNIPCVNTEQAAVEGTTIVDQGQGRELEPVLDTSTALDTTTAATTVSIQPYLLSIIIIIIMMLALKR